MGLLALLLCLLSLGCMRPNPPGENRDLVEQGRRIFFNETFAGNSRTCGTCHPATNNFTLDPGFIATLPDDDPLFVAEFDSNLARNFENPLLMRRLGLIVENQDGFDDLERNFNMRGIPHVLGMARSIASAGGPRTGWSGDGAPGDGSLREFATGAVIQHFTRTLARRPGIDFRLPTDEELDALEAFQLSLGRADELVLPLPFRDAVALRGQQLFNDPVLGKCFGCHSNAGANADPLIFGDGAGNLNFDTGVEALPDLPANLLVDSLPGDDGFGTPGDGTFNTPSLIEAADTPPFFHNNAVTTLEAAIAFYNGDAFRNSPAGALLREATGTDINLDATQVVAVATFLRAINVLENIRSGIELEQRVVDGAVVHARAREVLEEAVAEIDDAIAVLREGAFHPETIATLQEAKRLAELAEARPFDRKRLARRSIAQLERARGEILDVAPAKPPMAEE